MNFDGSRSFNSKYAEVQDPAYFLQNVAELFGADDLTVVNMEGVLTETIDDVAALVHFPALDDVGGRAHHEVGAGVDEP